MPVGAQRIDDDLEELVALSESPANALDPRESPGRSDRPRARTPWVGGSLRRRADDGSA